jgi:hypothetical protein
LSLLNLDSEFACLMFCFRFFLTRNAFIKFVLYYLFIYLFIYFARLLYAVFKKTTTGSPERESTALRASRLREVAAVQRFELVRRVKGGNVASCL